MSMISLCISEFELLARNKSGKDSEVTNEIIETYLNTFPDRGSRICALDVLADKLIVLCDKYGDRGRELTHVISGQIYRRRMVEARMR